MLDDTNREFVASEYLKLEVLPKAHYYRSTLETALYEEFFSSVVEVVPFSAVHFEPALKYAYKFGLSAFDALHLTAASLSGCQEFVTSEKRPSPIFRFTELAIRSIEEE